MISYCKTAFSILESLKEGIIHEYDAMCSGKTNCHQSGNPAVEVETASSESSSDNCSIGLLTNQRSRETVGIFS